MPCSQVFAAYFASRSRGYRDTIRPFLPAAGSSCERNLTQNLCSLNGQPPHSHLLMPRLEARLLKSALGDGDPHSRVVRSGEFYLTRTETPSDTGVLGYVDRLLTLKSLK